MPPRRFLIVATTLICLLHAYIGLRLLPDLPIAAAWRVFGGLLLLASCVLVPAGFMSVSIKARALADRLAWAGFVVTGLFSSLLVLSFLRDVFLITAAMWARGTTGNALAADSAVAVLVLAVIVTLAGFLNARRLARVVEVDVPLANLPAALQGFTIAQISDVHVGPTIKRDYVQRIVARVNSLDADLVAVTGDLVDGSVANLSNHTAPLKDLRGRHGVYLVTGNHEYYANAHAWIAEFQRLGLRVLLNEHVIVERDGARLVVAGVTDFSAGHFDPAHTSDPRRALAGAPDEALKLLLAHQPRSAETAAAAGFDLQLSGHTHGGQFWPWNLFVPLQQPYTAGLHRLGRLWVYVSRGTGYWGPPKRFGAPSEITRLRLVRA